MLLLYILLEITVLVVLLVLYYADRNLHRDECMYDMDDFLNKDHEFGEDVPGTEAFYIF